MRIKFLAATISAGSLIVPGPAAVASGSNDLGVASRLRSSVRHGQLTPLLVELGAQAPARAPASLSGLVQTARRADAVMRATVADLDPGAVRDAMLRRPIDTSFDQAPMLAVAAELAAAIDGFLAAPQPVLRAGLTVAPACDLQFIEGVLCVSGPGPNSYAAENDFLVSVDLGGDDVYANSTGGAGCFDDVDPAAQFCVAVALDLGGDDTYTTTTPKRACEVAGVGPAMPICTHGTGLGGIGMLVDTEGNDAYETRTRTASGQCDGNFSICGVVHSQGAGLFGVGVLADLAGDDTYLITTPRSESEDRSVTVSGQGTGTFGTGILWDDAGDDRYELTGPSTGFVNGGSTTGWSTYIGQGHGLVGNGVLLDGAGSDRIEINVEPNPGAEQRRTRSPWGEGAMVNVDAQGFGINVSGAPSLGAIITGDGPTLYELDLDARFKMSSRAQGWGPGGLIDDASGDDRYRVHQRTHPTFERQCACAVTLDLDTSNDGMLAFSFGWNDVSAQGIQSGAISDHSGDDVYDVAAINHVHVHADGSAGAVARAMGAGRINVGAQAAGSGSIEDAAGDDHYTVRTENLVDAAASGGGTNRAEARTGATSIAAQGVGGTLTDSGGGDRYEVRSTQHATNAPADPTTTDDGFLQIIAQGTAGGYGGIFDVDTGLTDTFHLDSEAIFSLCQGTYGAAPGWTGGQGRMLISGGDSRCSSTGAASLVSSADAVPAATLDIVSISGSVVTIALKDADGAPLSGRTVTLNEQQRVGFPYYVVGPFSWWQSYGHRREVITGADGTATTFLAPTACTPQCEERRVAAWFTGDAVAGPAFATGI